MNRRNQFEWREQTEDGLRFFRVTIHGKDWIYQSQYKGEDEWTKHDPISKEDWLAIRDALWRRYQRRRVAYKVVETVDRILAEFDKK